MKLSSCKVLMQAVIYRRIYERSGANVSSADSCPKEIPWRQRYIKEVANGDIILYSPDGAHVKLGERSLGNRTGNPFSQRLIFLKKLMMFNFLII